MKKLLALLLLTTCGVVGTAETGIGIPEEADGKKTAKVGTEMNFKNSILLELNRLFHSLQGQFDALDLRIKRIEKCIEENKTLHEENLKLREELNQNRDFVFKIAGMLGIKNSNTASLAEIQSDVCNKMKNDTMRLSVPPTGLLNEDEWETIELCLAGADDIIEKIREQETFIKKYQKKNIIIMED